MPAKVPAAPPLSTTSALLGRGSMLLPTALLPLTLSLLPTLPVLGRIDALFLAAAEAASAAEVLELAPDKEAATMDARTAAMTAAPEAADAAMPPVPAAECGGIESSEPLSGQSRSWVWVREIT